MPYANLETKRQYQQKYWERTREKQLARKRERAAHASETHKIWRKKNLKKRAADMRNWRKNPANRVASNLRSRIANVLRGREKFFSLSKVVGCSLSELKLHLEKQFRPGMSWETYGFWEIDHVAPCASFDLSVSEQQRQCFHFSNLQPLWKMENRSKNDKVA